MKIKSLENKKKIVFDILLIFFNKEDLEFVEDNYDIKIDSKIYYGDREISYKDNKALKIKLYNLFSKQENYKSSWGILTGSKPMKLFSKIGNEIKSEYLVSDSKYELLKVIAKNQEKYSFDPKNMNLYINIPFCPTRCDYCSYPTIIYNKHDYRYCYLKLILKELESLKVDRFHTIYIGGGTPSSLSTKQLEILLDNLNRFKAEEFTVEAGREDTLDFKKIDLFEKYHVNRISLNPQSFNQKLLRKLNRNQDEKKLIELIEYANEKFIVNMDFIVGLPEDDFTFSKNLKIIEKLLPKNITFHTLSRKSGSKFYESHKRFLEERENVEKTWENIFKFTEKFGYNPYYLYRQKDILANLENIGFERDKSACIYNIVVNEEIENIIGIGMNANSKFKSGEKLRLDRNIRDYKNNLNKKIEIRNKIFNKL